MLHRSSWHFLPAFALALVAANSAALKAQQADAPSPAGHFTRPAKDLFAAARADNAAEAERLLAAGADVPSQAVFTKGEKSYVFLEAAPGRYERREVKIGPEHDNKILVLVITALAAYRKRLWLQDRAGICEPSQS